MEKMFDAWLQGFCLACMVMQLSLVSRYGLCGNQFQLIAFELLAGEKDIVLKYAAFSPFLECQNAEKNAYGARERRGG